MFPSTVAPEMEVSSHSIFGAMIICDVVFCDPVSISDFVDDELIEMIGLFCVLEVNIICL